MYDYGHLSSPDSKPCRLKRVIVPGTFDPITNGHLDIITRACELCPQVIVAVAESKHKRGGPTFSIEERTELVEKACAHLEAVQVIAFDCLLIDLAHQLDTQAVVKGLRALTDFEYEFQQAAMNFHLDQSVETLFIMSHPSYSYLSSSIVKELVQFGGSVTNLVPPHVEEALLKRLKSFD